MNGIGFLQKMEIRGRYYILTSGGHSPDECKSAMQKYARRGDGSKMFYATQQLNSLCGYDKDNRESMLPVIKATRTNMINRLSVILFEDVSYRSMKTFETVCALIDEWKQKRTEDPNNDGSEILKQICLDISSAKKARQPSYLRNFYGFRTEIASKEDFIKNKSLAWVYQNEKEAVDWVTNQSSSYVISYALKEWKRLKTSKRESDRFVFLIVPILWLQFGWDETDVPTRCEIQDIILTKFDDFVYDMHTGKGKLKTKQDFVSEGAVVYNEDLTAVNSDMKRLYERQLKPTRSIHNPVFCNVRMITDGLCGGKLPCFYASFRGVDKVVKPISTSHNFGLDYAYVDSQKQKFGIPALNVKLVRVENLAVEKTGDGNFILNDSSTTLQVFAVMDVIQHMGDLGKNRVLLDDEHKFDEMLRIRLFNGLFRTSDNILRNILVGVDHKFVPIDENDILGKREKIFNINEPVKQSIFWSRDRLIRIIHDLDLQRHKESILSDLCVFGLHDKLSELGKRIDNYESVVLGEA